MLSLIMMHFSQPVICTAGFVLTVLQCSFRKKEKKTKLIKHVTFTQDIKLSSNATIRVFSHAHLQFFLLRLFKCSPRYQRTPL